MNDPMKDLKKSFEDAMKPVTDSFNEVMKPMTELTEKMTRQTQEQFDPMKETFAPAVKMADINRKTLEKIFTAQTEYMTDFINTSLEQMKSLVEAKTPQEAMHIQMEFIKTLDEKFTHATEKELSSLVEARDEITALVEHSMSEMGDNPLVETFKAMDLNYFDFSQFSSQQPSKNSDNATGSSSSAKKSTQTASTKASAAKTSRAKKAPAAATTGEKTASTKTPLSKNSDTKTSGNKTVSAKTTAVKSSTAPTASTANKTATKTASKTAAKTVAKSSKAKAPLSESIQPENSKPTASTSPDGFIWNGAEHLTSTTPGNPQKTATASDSTKNESASTSESKNTAGQ